MDWMKTVKESKKPRIMPKSGAQTMGATGEGFNWQEDPWAMFWLWDIIWCTESMGESSAWRIYDIWRFWMEWHHLARKYRQQRKEGGGWGLECSNTERKRARKKTITRELGHMLNLDEEYPCSMQSLSLLFHHGETHWVYTACDFLMGSINRFNA